MATTAPVAPKVKWAALVGSLVGLVLTGLPTILANQSIVSGLPAWVPIVAGFLAGGGLPGWAGYVAPHQVRPLDITASDKSLNDGPDAWSG